MPEKNEYPNMGVVYALLAIIIIFLIICFILSIWALFKPGQQGQIGPRGPRGPKGEKGDPGTPGVCTCGGDFSLTPQQISIIMGFDPSTIKNQRKKDVVTFLKKYASGNTGAIQPKGLTQAEVDNSVSQMQAITNLLTSLDESQILYLLQNQFPYNPVLDYGRQLLLGNLTDDGNLYSTQDIVDQFNVLSINNPLQMIMNKQFNFQLGQNVEDKVVYLMQIMNNNPMYKRYVISYSNLYSNWTPQDKIGLLQDILDEYLESGNPDIIYLLLTELKHMMHNTNNLLSQDMINRLNAYANKYPKVSVIVTQLTSGANNTSNSIIYFSNLNDVDLSQFSKLNGMKLIYNGSSNYKKEIKIKLDRVKLKEPNATFSIANVGNNVALKIEAKNFNKNDTITLPNGQELDIKFDNRNVYFN